MASRWQLTLFTFFLALCFQGIDAAYYSTWWFQEVVGRVAFVALIVLVCGGISLCTWCWCSIHQRCRKDRVGLLSSVKPGMPPVWSQHLYSDPRFQNSGFGEVSEGFQRLGPNLVTRTRPGHVNCDMARWSVPMTSGKHVFEIVWPWGCRGSEASVGVGTLGAPLTSKGRGCIVGCNKFSWGLHLVKRQTQHNGQRVARCPGDGSFVPDHFLMYIDLDVGTLGWGNNVTYWGESIANVKATEAQPLYLMVATDRQNTNIEVTYMGSAASEFISPPVYSEKECNPLHVTPPPAYTAEDLNSGPSGLAQPPREATLYNQTTVSK